MTINTIYIACLHHLLSYHPVIGQRAVSKAVEYRRHTCFCHLHVITFWRLPSLRLYKTVHKRSHATRSSKADLKFTHKTYLPCSVSFPVPSRAQILAMAKNYGTAVLVVAFLLIAVTMANAAEPVSPLICNQVYGVKEHETCFALARAFKIPLKQFLHFNPNINCRNLFIGQWVVGLPCCRSRLIELFASTPSGVQRRSFWCYMFC